LALYFGVLVTSPGGGALEAAGSPKPTATALPVPVSTLPAFAPMLAGWLTATAPVVLCVEVAEP